MLTLYDSKSSVTQAGLLHLIAVYIHNSLHDSLTPRQLSTASHQETDVRTARAENVFK